MDTYGLARAARARARAHTRTPLEPPWGRRIDGGYSRSSSDARTSRASIAPNALAPCDGAATTTSRVPLPPRTGPEHRDEKKGGGGESAARPPRDPPQLSDAHLARDEDVADAQRAALDERRRDRAEPFLHARLDHDAGRVALRVRLELENLGLEQHLRLRASAIVRVRRYINGVRSRRFASATISMAFPRRRGVVAAPSTAR